MCLISYFWSIFIPFNSSFKSSFLIVLEVFCQFQLTTGTYNFTSGILSAAFVGVFIASYVPPAVRVLISVKAQFSDQVKIKGT